ncbi:DUF1214 domain-containing protein [Altererythrobacter litoralis]|uniref:DUF1214 domain-containing protein n=1 Tax=Altererythrobacter litoralis TaxID=3113904 RepID=A0ABU7GCF3_9SPHN|nr:DUF1214 domain-containing protein [Erythrobacteraceae bacterium 1XM1-14]
MKRALAFLVAGLIGIGIGAYSALAMSGLLPGETRSFAGLDIHGWVGDLTTGSADASPYVRARIARHGLLALAKSEAIYFTREQDDHGGLLNERCRYRLSGGPMPSQWWSVTLYNSESYLPDNSDGALSFDASRAGEGAWSAIVSPNKPAEGENWISSRNAGRFDLTLRLYVPDEGVLDRPAEMIEMPVIERLDCEGDSA